MALDESLYCTIRDVVRDAPITPTTRDRMLRLLTAFKAQDDLVRELLVIPRSELSLLTRTVLEESAKQIGNF